MSISQLFKKNNYDLQCQSVTESRITHVRNQDATGTVVASGASETVLLSLAAFETPTSGVFEIVAVLNGYLAITATTIPLGFRFAIKKNGTTLVAQNTWKTPSVVANPSSAEFCMVVRGYDTKVLNTSDVYSLTWEQPSAAGGESWSFTAKEITFSAAAVEWL